MSFRSILLFVFAVIFLPVLAAAPTSTPAPAATTAPKPAATAAPQASPQPSTAPSATSTSSRTTSAQTLTAAATTSTGATSATGSGLLRNGLSNYRSNDMVSPGGSFTYSYPIALPEGTHGISPALSLDYSSSGANDWLGIGFQLSGFSKIERDPSYPINFTSSDHYMLDGNKLFLNGADTSFHFEKESFDTIQIFTPSAPNTPTSDPNADAASYWVVTKKDGTKFYYGNTTDSRIEAVGQGTKARVWALNKVIDTLGNYYSVSYSEDTTNGDYYPVKMVYTKNDSNAMSSYKAVLFSWESRTDHGVQYQPSIVDQDYRLKWISVMVGTDASGNGGSLLRKYRLDYAYNALGQNSQLTTIQEYGNDGNIPPSGLLLTSWTGSGTVLPQTTLNWSSDIDSVSTVNNGIPAENWSTYKTFTGDFNGDGYSDIVGIYPSNEKWSARTKFGQANGGFTIRQTATEQGGYWSVTAFQWFVGDFNGDGISDIAGVYQNNGKWCCAVHAGTASGAFVELGGAFEQGGYWTISAFQWFVGDFNGDGISDFAGVYQNNGKWCCTLHVGTTSGTFLEQGGAFEQGGYWNVSAFQWFVGDFNGDGISDIAGVYQNNGKWCSVLHVGSASGTFQEKGGAFEQGGFWDVNAFIWFVGDFNGDGISDFVGIYEYGGQWCCTIHTGTIDGSFTAYNGVFQQGEYTPSTIAYYWAVTDSNLDGVSDIACWYTKNNQWNYVLHYGKKNGTFVDRGGVLQAYVSGSNTITGDFNGDGRIDFSIFNTDGTTQNNLINNAQPRIVSVLLPSGGTISATYTPAAQVPGAIDPSSNSGSSIANSNPRPLVTTLTVSDANGTTITTNYSYSKGKIITGARSAIRDLGFQTVTQTDANTGVSTITTYSQSFPYQGLPTNVVIQDNTGAKWVETSTTYSKTDTIAGTSYFIYPTQQIVKKYDGQAIVQATFRKDFGSYDSLGNLTQSTDWGEVNADLSDKDARDNVEVNAAYAQSSTTKAVRLISQNVQTYDANAVKDISSKAEYYYDSNGALGMIGAGLPTKTIVWSDASTNATTTMNYDVWGNALNVQDARVNAGEYGGNTAVNTYDNAYHAQILTQTNALGQTTSLTYDSLNRPATATDPNGNVTTTVYDALNRAVKTYDSIDSLTQPTVQTDYFLVGSKWYTRTKAKTSGANTVDSYTYTDGLGRTIQTKKQAVGGWITQDYYWDASGRNYQISVPYLTTTNPTASTTDPFPFTSRDATQKQTVLNFDKLDRVVKTTNPDTTFATAAYLGNTTTNVDENDHVTQIVTSPNTVAYQTFTGTSANKTLYSTTTTKTYRGQVQIVDNAGNTITSSVDYLGRRIGYNDPNMGVWSYSYDKNGNLSTQTDAKNQTISYTYDKLNRLIGKSATDTTVNATYTYDANTYGIGRLSSVSYNRGSDTYLYDIRGRVTSTTRTLDSITKSESFTYDSADRKVTETLPDGEVLTSTYGADGNITALSGTNNYVTGITYSALNKVKTLAYGNGITTTYNYYDDATTDPTTGLHHSYRLRQILAGTGNAVMNLSYSYDKGDNVKARTDGNNASYSETYGYDELDRLTSASSTVYGSLSFAYDAINRLTSKDGNTYSYYAAHPHQVQSFGSNNYTYDNNGNMLTRSDGRTIVYDAENRVTSVSDVGSYAYNSDRQRTVKTEGSKTTYYFFDDYELEYTSGSVTNTLKYYKANDVKVAQRSTPDGLLFVHSDHLGSSTRMTNTSGTVVRTQGYKPYGGDAYKTGTAETKYQFTGYERDKGDLDYANARYYDNQLGRFIQADPAVWSGILKVKLSLSELSSPFIYCMNNPIKFKDPSGLDHISLTYNKATNTLTVTKISYNPGSAPTITNMGTYTATNNQRSGSEYTPGTLPSTIPANNTQGKTYIPSGFPEGTWNITGVTHPNNDTYGTTKISTDAVKTVMTYTQNDDGTFTPNGTQVDTGYALHGGGTTNNSIFSALGNNNVADKTQGCVRNKNSDIDNIGALVQSTMNAGGTASITVLSGQDSASNKSNNNGWSSFWSGVASFFSGGNSSSSNNSDSSSNSNSTGGNQ